MKCTQIFKFAGRGKFYHRAGLRKLGLIKYLKGEGLYYGFTLSLSFEPSQRFAFTEGVRLPGSI